MPSGDFPRKYPVGLSSHWCKECLGGVCSLSRSAETLQIIKKCWTEDVFDWEGTHYHLKGVRAMPKPVQQPHPPIFMPARNPRAMERNAREGYGATQGAGRWTLEQTDPGWWRQWQ